MSRSEGGSAPTPAPSSGGAGQGLSPRLGPARVALRKDLQVSRHRFRGKTSYILIDPLTAESHRYDAADYAIMTLLSDEKELCEVFADVVASGVLEREDEERFFEFVFGLHRTGLLRLPVADDGALYKRHQQKAAAKVRSRFTGLLFLRIPLWNPDAFLLRARPLAAIVFTKWALAAWCLLMGLAGLALARSWEEFTAPIADVFASGNLPFLWFTLLALKLVHEFGHAFACRHFGGRVPEMGVYLMVFTPCAYVDASSSWGFSNKRHRLAVSLAGMYVELAIAAVALLAWSALEPGFLRSLLHNVVILGSVVTLLFNANPLMRYDGYYALSDVAEIPNLRARATAQGIDLLCRILLGIERRAESVSSGMRAFLVAFSIASAIYKVFLVLGISAVIAMKFYTLGLAVAATYVFGALFGILRRLVPFLLKAEETAHVRKRALLVGGVGLICAPAAVMAVPVASHEHIPSVMGFHDEAVVRAAAPGFLADVNVRAGAPVQAGELLFALEDPSLASRMEQLKVELEVARLEWQAVEFESPVLGAEARSRLAFAEASLQDLQQEVQSATLRAPKGGHVVEGVSPRELGRWVERGELLARIAVGEPLVRALLSESQMSVIAPAVGEMVEFRVAGAPGRRFRGVVERIVPVGTRAVAEDYLNHLSLDDFAMNPLTGMAGKSLFELEVLIYEQVPSLRGATGWLRFSATKTPLGLAAWRKLLTFLRRLDDAG